MKVNMLRVIFLSSFFISSVFTHLNVFISQEEVMKLFGVNAELYYVRDGVINSYALDYVVLVPAHISDLEFSWQSLTNQPLPYVISILYDKEGALLPPQVNISERGFVPSTVQTFRIKLPCSGYKNAEIDVRLQINITSANKLYQDIWLNFRRNKICYKETLPLQSRNSSVKMEADSLVTNGSSFYVAAGCATAMLSLVVALTSLLYLRNKKLKNHNSIHTSYTTAADGSHGNVFIRLDALGRPASAGSGSYATIASIHKFPLGSRRSPSPYATTHLGGHVYSRPEPPSYFPPNGSCCESDHLTKASQVSWKSDNSTDRLRRIFVQRSALATGKVIHEGTFGKILEGQLHSKREVIIKTVSDAATKIQISLLMSEGSLLAGMTHENLLSPLAACPPSGNMRPLIAYPYPSNGNLKKYLLDRKNGGSGGASQYVAMAVGAARGLVYLHTRHIVHRDVATRNCVVDENLQVKITDNALSRDLFPDDYHCLCDNENRSIKWMALEALQHGQFSAASDVWSFGVLLWELATLAQQPYNEVDPFEVTAFLRDGYRLSQPINCPDELFTVMSCCWLTAVEARPSLVQLLAYLLEFQTALAEYI